MDSRISYGKYGLRPLQAIDLEFVRQLRNRDNVRLYLSSGAKMTEEDQLAWYHEVYKNSPEQQRFILEFRNSPIGTLALVGINLVARETYCRAGIIVMPEYLGKKAADIGIKLMEHYAFGLLGIDIGISAIFKENRSAIAMLKRNGFERLPVAEAPPGLLPSDDTHLYYAKKRASYQSLDEVVSRIKFNPRELESFPKIG